MRKRRGIVERHLVRDRREGALGCDDILGEGTVAEQVELPKDPITRLERGDTGTDLLDDAGGVEAQSGIAGCADPGEEPDEPRSGFDLVEVRPVHGGRLYPDKNLIVSRCWAVDLDESHVLGRAISIVDGGLHPSTSAC